MIKSAVFPFSSWLYISMFASLPTSSLLHSSLLVLIGILTLIYLFTCNYKFIYMALSVIVILSHGSSVYGMGKCTASSDIKCVIASSTVANIGISLLALYYYIISYNLIIYHALIKAALFLHIMHLNNRIYRICL